MPQPPYPLAGVWWEKPPDFVSVSVLAQPDLDASGAAPYGWPRGSWFYLVLGSFKLVTSATAGTRVADVRLEDSPDAGGTVYARLVTPLSQAASTTAWYSFGPNMQALSSSAIATQNVGLGPSPAIALGGQIPPSGNAGGVSQGGGRLVMGFLGGQTGDALSVPVFQGTLWTLVPAQSPEPPLVESLLL